MKTTSSSITWQRAASAGLRVVAIGTGHLLLVSGYLLQTSGSIVSKLGNYTRDRGRRHTA